jgi:hypothetical protein
MHLLLFIAWLTPFDLPASQVLHWALSGTLGNWYLLLLPSVGLAAFTANRIVFVPIHRLPPALFPWVISGMCAVLGALIAGKVNLALSIQDCGLGYVIPAAAAAGIGVHPDRRAILSALFRGWDAYMFLGIPVLGYAILQSISLGTGWWDGSPLQRWTMWRYELSNAGNVYALWFGNANKASNVLILMLLIAPVALAVDGAPPSPRRMRISALLSTMHLMAMCSRLGLLLLPVALLAGGYLKPLSRRTLVLAGAVTVAVAAAGYSALIEVLSALFVGSPEAGGGGVLSTFAAEGGRFEQWLEVWRTWHPSLHELLVGYGSGYYGIQTFGTSDAETHNFLIDRILASGALGLLAVVTGLLIAWMGTKGLDARSMWLVRLSIASLILMSVREFSPSYLFRTSFAGVVVAILISLPKITALRGFVPRESPR